MPTECSALFEAPMDENRHLAALVDTTALAPLPSSTFDEKAQPPHALPLPGAVINTSVVHAEPAASPTLVGDKPGPRPMGIIAPVSPLSRRFSLAPDPKGVALRLLFVYLWAIWAQRSNIDTGLDILRHFRPHDPALAFFSSSTVTLIAVVGGTLSIPLLVIAALRHGRRLGYRPLNAPFDPVRDTLRGRFVDVLKHDAIFFFLQALVAGLAGSLVLLPFKGAAVIDPMRATAASVLGALVLSPFWVLSLSLMGSD